MSISSIQSTAHTAPVNTQHNSSFSIADNTMPSGGGGNCDDLRRSLFSTLLSAMSTSISQTDRGIIRPTDDQIFNKLDRDLSEYDDCDGPSNGTPDDIIQHNALQTVSDLIDEGYDAQQAVGEFLKQLDGANQQLSPENRINWSQVSQDFSTGIAGAGAWILRRLFFQPGYGN
jgi:hypothetical protein